MTGTLATLSISLFLAQHVATPPPPPPASPTVALPEFCTLNAVRQAKSGGTGLGMASLPDRTDIRMNSASTAIQADSVIVVDPNNRNHIIGAANDTRSGHFECVYYASFD